ERYEIRFSVTKAAYEQLEEAKNRLSSSIDGRPTVETVVTKLLNIYLASKTARKPTPSHGRHIPSALRREVRTRDGGRCTYCASDGTRCSARAYLQIDHIVPVARGGKTELSNLRLLCSAHNRLEARSVFGKDLFERKIYTRRWE